MKKFLEQKKSAIVSGMSNNKGFSLVELIIVVAIMAVLMGVLAPQYLRFVETSRIQADQTAFNEVMKVMSIATATMGPDADGYSVTWDLNGDLIVDDGTGTAAAGDIFYDELRATLGSSMNIGAPSSTRYQKTVTGDHNLIVGVDAVGVPFIYTTSAGWSYALQIPTTAQGGGTVTTDPVDSSTGAYDNTI